MKKYIPLLILIFILGVSATCVQAFPTPSLAAQEYIKRGKGYYKDHDFARSIEEFNKALMADPTCEEAKKYLKLMGYGDDSDCQTSAVCQNREQGASPAASTKSVATHKELAQEWDEADRLDSSENRQAIEALREQFDLEKQIAIQKFRANAAKEQQAALEELYQEYPESVTSRTKVQPVVNINKSKPEQKSQSAAKVKKTKTKSKNKSKTKAKTQSIATSGISTIPTSSDEESPERELSATSTIQSVTQPALLKETTTTQERKAEQKPAKPLSRAEAKAAARQAKIEAKQAKIAAKKAAKIAAKEAAEEKVLQKAKDKAALKNKKKKQKQSASTAQPEVQKRVPLEDSLTKKSAEMVNEVESETSESPEAEELVASNTPQAKKYQKAKQEAALAKSEKELIEKLQTENALKERRMRKKMEEDFQAKEKQLLGQLKDEEEVLAKASAGTSSASTGLMSAARISEIEAQNANLRKQLADVIAMSEKDQELIQRLQSQSSTQSELVPIPVTPQPEIQAQVQEIKDRKVELKQEGEKVKTLQTKIAALEEDVHSKKFDFTSKQLDYEKKIEELQAELGNAQYAKAKSEDELKDQLQTIKDALQKKVSELNDAQERLLFMEQKLKKRESQYSQKTNQYEELKKTLSDLESRLSGLQGKMGDGEETDKPMGELSVNNMPQPANAREVEYQRWIQRHDKLVTKLKQKLLWAREQIDYLGSYDIKLNDQKMAALKEELAKAKQQLSLRQGSVPSDFENQELLEQRLKDTQERLGMVEKILKEKDQQIQELENQLNGALSAIQ